MQSDKFFWKKLLISIIRRNGIISSVIDFCLVILPSPENLTTYFFPIKLLMVSLRNFFWDAGATMMDPLILLIGSWRMAWGLESARSFAGVGSTRSKSPSSMLGVILGEAWTLGCNWPDKTSSPSGSALSIISSYYFGFI